MKPLKTRKVAAQSFRNGLNLSAVANPPTNSRMIRRNPASPPGFFSFSLASSASDGGAPAKRSRRNTAGRIPTAMATAPTAIASPAAPSTMSSKRTSHCMMTRNQGAIM
jgi:hypothetical protein